MTETELPSRAKPEVLYRVCSLLDDNAVKRSELYDDIDYDRRQISASTDYGHTLGFIEYVGESQQTPKIRLGSLGTPLHYADSMDESGVRNAFKRAIESYEPYRNGLVAVYDTGQIQESEGQKAIVIDDLKDAVNRHIEGQASNREINLLLKTAEAAGLGERKVGRRGYQTRLILSSEFEAFAQDLLEQYGAPEPISSPESEEKDGQKNKEDTDVISADESVDSGHGETDTGGGIEDTDGTESIIAKLRTNDITLEIGVDITGKEDKEVLDIINKIEGMSA